MSHRIGIDIGGTFTDLIMIDESSGELTQTKTPSTPRDPSKGAANGISKLLETNEVKGKNVERVIHGTTVATNAVIERAGAKTALVTTNGFRDILQIGRQARPHLYDAWKKHSQPLVPRERRFTISEKITPNGEVQSTVNQEELSSLITDLGNSGAESVAICLMHSYINPEHEEQIASAIEENLDGINAICSSNILPEYREYERMSTTVINAYVQPLMSDYINRLEGRITENNIDAPLQIMQSNGGLMTAETASEKSVHTLLSGPSAGVLSGQYISSLTEMPNIITFDMGGTSADICTIQGGEPEYSAENELGGNPVRIRMHDINAIGAGGGSIGWIDSGGALRVGPRSAGSQPGPICYGRGGTEPTVTDANLLLGRLNPHHLLEGDLDIKYERAEQFMDEQLAGPLDMSTKEAAQGICDVVTANMVRGIRRVSVERGYDPRDSSLVAFGGAGPLHSHRLINELEMGEAIIPITPGVASSLGLLAANTKHSYVQTILDPLSETSIERLNSEYEKLEEEAHTRLESENVAEGTTKRLADMKYERQGYELTVSIPDDAFESGHLSVIRNAFEREHMREYDFTLDNESIEIVNIRVQSVAMTEEPTLKSIKSADTDVTDIRHTTREAFFDGDQYTTDIYKRDSLKPGHLIDGPTIVEELSSTTVVGPEQKAEIDEYGNIHITGVNK